MDITRDAPQQSLAVRVGDIERHACVVTLIGHHLQGRLSTEELERRQRLAMVAVSTTDLRSLLMDLPPPEATVPRSHGRRLTVPLPERMPRTVRALMSVVPVLGAASFGQWFWQYSAEGHLLTGALAGAVGYATHAVTASLRR